MSRPRDIDEGILHHAVELLSIVRKEEPSLHVDMLEDVPELLVYLFEKITTETIPVDMKPFGSLSERADTLQAILDTIEQTLSLPLSHLSGMGLASLDRRQLSDVLDIFDDLVRYSSAEVTQNRGHKHDDSVPMSVLDLLNQSPEQDNFITPPLANKQGRLSAKSLKADYDIQPCDFTSVKVPGSNLREHGANTVSATSHHDIENRRQPNDDYGTKSSTTIAKEIYRREQPTNDNKRERNNHAALRPVANPSIQFISPKQLNSNIAERHHVRDSKAAKGTYEDRYVPYQKERLVAKRGNTGTPVNVRKPSVKTFRNERYPPSHVRNENQYTKPLPKIGKAKNVITDNDRRSVKHSLKNVKLKGIDSVDGRKKYDHKERLRSNRHCSIESIEQERNSSSRASVKGGRKGSVRSVRSRPPSLSSRYHKTPTDARSPTNGRHTPAPSVISTKARKHSERSPKGVYSYRPVRRGHVSPQTTSLCSSLKLLEEFDYVTRRLKEIRHLKQEHLNAIKDLEHEAVRLESVMSHVHRKSRHPSFKINRRDIGLAV